MKIKLVWFNKRPFLTCGGDGGVGASGRYLLGLREVDHTAGEAAPADIAPGGSSTQPASDVIR